ncbi:centrin-2-like [Homalodisca vitripennis]|uniref:centrin-2-like n=1 Tax=Homalodisca vitripennis TaxID=197043 RepID=UPI001EEA8AAC|nr:centrin-2-like [Homalodisca vitripennis]
MDVFKEITEEQKAIIQNICERFNKEFNKNTENQHLETSSSTRSDTSRKIQTETNLRDDTNHLEASALTSPNVTGAIKKTSASINEITQRQRTKIERVFDCFDVNKIGKLETKYLKWALNALGIRTEKGDIEKMLSETEDEESETLSYEEFIYLVAPMIAKMKAKKMAKKMAKKKRKGSQE